MREEIGSITGAEARYAVGGGSILAARWVHRYSYDIDLVVPPDTPLGMFAEANNPASGFEYARCCIRTRDGAIEVTTATRARGEKTRRIGAASAERDFEAAGLNAYLRAKGPGAEALLDYARESCARYQDALVFEADADGVRAWQTAKASMNVATANRSS